MLHSYSHCFCFIFYLNKIHCPWITDPSAQHTAPAPRAVVRIYLISSGKWDLGKIWAWLRIMELTHTGIGPQCTLLQRCKKWSLKGVSSIGVCRHLSSCCQKMLNNAMQCMVSVLSLSLSLSWTLKQNILLTQKSKAPNSVSYATCTHMYPQRQRRQSLESIGEEPSESYRNKNDIDPIKAFKIQSTLPTNIYMDVHLYLCYFWGPCSSQEYSLPL